MAPPKIDLQKLRLLLQNGMPQKEIARLLGVSAAAVCKRTRQLRSDLFEEPRRKSFLEDQEQFERDYNSLDRQLDEVRAEIKNAKATGGCRLVHHGLKVLAEMRQHLKRPFEAGDIAEFHRLVSMGDLDAEKTELLGGKLRRDYFELMHRLEKLKRVLGEWDAWLQNLLSAGRSRKCSVRETWIQVMAEKRKLSHLGPIIRLPLDKLSGVEKTEGQTNA